MIKYIPFVILALLIAPGAFAFTLPDGDACKLGAYLQYIEDREGKLGPEQIQQEKLNWQQHAGDIFNKGFSASVWWLKFSIANPNSDLRQRLIELSYPILDQIDVYVYSDARQVSRFRLGDKLPYAMRPFDHHNFIMPVKWQARQSLDFFIRIKTSGQVYVPLTLWQRNAFISFDSKRIFGQSIFNGALGVFVLYNLLLFFAVKDRSYLYLAVSEGAVLLFLAGMTGVAFRYLWPDATIWNDRAIAVCISGTFVFGILFANRILRLDELSGIWSRWVLGFIAMGCACMGGAFIAPYHIALKSAMAYAAVSVCAAIITGILCWRRGASAARFYTAALTAILVGFIPMTLAATGLISPNVVTRYASYIGAMVGALILSFALNERINIDRRLRHKAQEMALATATRANTGLEQIIGERTCEKQALNERLWLLSNTDQLTGIKNRRYLEQCLAEECLRCGQKGRSVAMVLIDIDFFKKVNDIYGHAAGDACLSEVARRIAACVMRPGDEVARYGGEEFCVVLPEIDIKGALTVAERMRKMIECLPVRYEDQDIGITISAGVAVLFPSSGSGPDRIFMSADRALYAAKEAGRNCVRIDPDPNGGTGEKTC